jgi:hypothetical protein
MSPLVIPQDHLQGNQAHIQYSHVATEVLEKVESKLIIINVF